MQAYNKCVYLRVCCKGSSTILAISMTETHGYANLYSALSCFFPPVFKENVIAAWIVFTDNILCRTKGFYVLNASY